MDIKDWASNEINRVGAMLRAAAITASPETFRLVFCAAVKQEEANVWDEIKGGLGLRSQPGGDAHPRLPVIQIDREMIDREYAPEVEAGHIWIDEDLLDRIRALDEAAFGVWTCCDGVSGLVYSPATGYGVSVIVKPAGPLTKWSTSWARAADWWLAVFRSQPLGFHYTTGGWHIYYRFAIASGEVGFDDEPEAIWEGIGE